MKPRNLDLLLNVFLPLVAGVFIYGLNFENVIFQLIKNYLPDGLWAYAFLSVILIIWDRIINPFWLTAAFLFALLFEVLQYMQLVEGTADIIDVIVYYTCFIVALILNNFFKQSLKLTYAKSKKHWLSFLTLIVFMFFAVASKTSNTHKETFSYEDSYEVPSPQGNFIEMNDGSKVYGNDISWKTGLTVKDIITLDKTKYKISDVKGFMRYGNYYARFHKEYLQRLVHGKINVYVHNVNVVTTTPMNGHNYTDVKNKTEYYYQLGEDGDLKKFDRSDIQGLLQDCPAAAKMADISKKQLQKELEDDPSYMNKVFHLYSNCK